MSTLLNFLNSTSPFWLLQRRTQDFPEGMTSANERGHQPIWPIFPKTAWKWRNFGPEGTLDPSLLHSLSALSKIFYWSFLIFITFLIFIELLFILLTLPNLKCFFQNAFFLTFMRHNVEKDSCFSLFSLNRFPDYFTDTSLVWSWIVKLLAGNSCTICSSLFFRSVVIWIVWF